MHRYSECLPAFVHDEGIDSDALESKHLTGKVRFSKKAQVKSDTENNEPQRYVRVSCLIPCLASLYANIIGKFDGVMRNLDISSRKILTQMSA